MAWSFGTATDIITLALKNAGVVGQGQTAASADLTDCYNVLNLMLSEWQRRRWLIWHLVDVSCASTGASSYTIGSGGNFAVARPDRLEAAYARMTSGSPNQPDYPLEVIDNYEDYAAIVFKSLKSVPSIVFYDAAYPTGNLYFWPVPSSQWQLHVIVKEQIGTFPDLVTALTIPAEHLNAMVWNLTKRVLPMYGKPPRPEVDRQSAVSLSAIRNANTQIATLKMPIAIGRNGSATAPGAAGPFVLGASPLL
jgi:hypothetical protein